MADSRVSKGRPFIGRGERSVTGSITSKARPFEGTGCRGRNLRHTSAILLIIPGCTAYRIHWSFREYAGNLSVPGANHLTRYAANWPLTRIFMQAGLVGIEKGNDRFRGVFVMRPAQTKCQECGHVSDPCTVRAIYAAVTSFIGKNSARVSISQTMGFQISLRIEANLSEFSGVSQMRTLRFQIGQPRRAGLRLRRRFRRWSACTGRSVRHSAQQSSPAHPPGSALRSGRKPVQRPLPCGCLRPWRPGHWRTRSDR